MNVESNPYASSANDAVSWADEAARTEFIRKTYLHLAGAMAAFVTIEMLVFNMMSEAAMANVMQWMWGGRFNWLIVLGAFMAVSWIADSWARSATSLSVQYAGLSLYVLAESVIFIPLLFMASYYDGAIQAAGLMTLIVFTGLTLIVFTTRADFSWMGRYLMLFGFGALGLIVCAAVFQFELGAIFSGVMVLFASAYILYNTSNVLHQYSTTQYVAASLALFASVALLLWYILSLVMSFGRD